MDSSTLPDDELVLPHFEQRLLAELVAHQKAGNYRPPAAGVVAATNGTAADDAVTDLGALPAGLRVPRSGRRRWVVVAVGGIAAAILAATLVVVRDDGQPDVRSESPIQEDPASMIEERIRDEISGAVSTSIVHTVNDGAAGRQSWTDAVSHAERHLLPGVGGQPLDRGRSVVPDFHEEEVPEMVPTRDVNYCRREWADTEAPWLSVGTAVDTLSHGLGNQLRVDGTEVVDGRELLRVVADGDAIADETDFEGSGDMTEAEEEQLAEDTAAGLAGSSPTYFVDPDSLLPVLVRETDGSTTTIEFLPRETSLDLLVPPVPEGFTQVPQPPTDEEIAALGCL